ncbi:MAG TPA: hypothetical protein VET83_10280 [Candidatus Dormibacteraeota bacterium]|nr:hypothetical protein [Candidatus Dormibacteraeota bacterium]
MKRIAGTTLLLVLASTLLAAAVQDQPAHPSVQGTIHAIQPKSGSLDLVTGVGMALRIVHVAAPTTARLAPAGAPLSTLKRGDIVRVQCHWSGKQLVADRIDKVGAR